jgi:CheY-like chemotaxis protein
MKILFLDDMASRRRVAQQWFKGNHEIIYAKNAAEAIGLYCLHQASYEPFDLVSLDHDLGERWNGMDVVEAIIRMHERGYLGYVDSTHFAIHSWNIPAADRMKNKLEIADFKVTQEPFSPPAYMDSLDDPDDDRSTGG